MVETLGIVASSLVWAALTGLLYYCGVTIETIQRPCRLLVLLGAFASTSMSIAYVALLFTPVDRQVFRYSALLAIIGVCITLRFLITRYRRVAQGIESLSENG